jgi:hypothetical protein
MDIYPQKGHSAKTDRPEPAAYVSHFSVFWPGIPTVAWADGAPAASSEPGRVPARLSCGTQVHTTPQSLAESISATRASNRKLPPYRYVERAPKSLASPVSMIRFPESVT